MDYESAYELMEHAVGVFGGDVQGLKKHKEEAQYSFPARNSADAFAKARAKTKKLTLDQWNGLCTIWPQKDKNRRWLIDAPSGSGKTFVAICLVCEFVRYPGRFELTGGVLLCSHSKRLQKKTVEEVQEYMKEVGHEVAVEEVAAHFSTITSTTTGVVLVVATIDALLVMSRSESTDVGRGGGSSNAGSGDKDVGALRFSVAVVDEGQHMFSRQPMSHLEGQHTVAAAEVRVELQRWMVKGGKSCVYVFHDPNQTYTEQAVYPEGLTPLAPFHQIVRNPARVRDMAVEYCGSLERERGQTGRLVFHELHKQAVLGAELWLCDVRPTRLRIRWGTSNYVGNLLSSTHTAGSSSTPQTSAKKGYGPGGISAWRAGWNTVGGASLRESEHLKSIRNYAEQLAPVLDKLLTNKAALTRVDNEEQVAVLMPGYSQNFIDELRQATIERAATKETKEALGDTQSGSMRVVWCAVENYSGMECAYVVVTGFQMPEYLIRRSQNGFDTRVDSSAYLAVTRCTYQLVFVEVEAAAFSEHWLIADAKNDEASRSQGFLTASLVDGATIQGTLEVNLCDAPPTKELNRATSIKLIHHGDKGYALQMKNTTFKWTDCLRMKVLDLSKDKTNRNQHSDSHSISVASAVLKELQGSIVGHVALQQLHLANNKLASFPVELMSLTALQYLSVRDNCIKLVPPGIGALTALHELHLQENKLESLPQEIGLLVMLKKLTLMKNSLTSLPDAISLLTALRDLDITNNKLEKLPEKIGALIALQRLRLERNELVCVPNGIRLLTALTSLNLAHNKLVSIPEQIGELAALQKLRLDNNRLEKVPKSIGSLAALMELRLNNNELTLVPAELGSLRVLEQLNLQHNRLVALPVELHFLTELEWLSVASNALQSVPAELGSLSRSAIDLHDNPQLLAPLSAVAQQADAPPFSDWKQVVEVILDSTQHELLKALTTLGLPRSCVRYVKFRKTGSVRSAKATEGAAWRWRRAGDGGHAQSGGGHAKDGKGSGRGKAGKGSGRGKAGKGSGRGKGKGKVAEKGGGQGR
jgi:Leucine-rich repeat (LRR) protein